MILEANKGGSRAVWGCKCYLVWRGEYRFAVSRLVTPNRTSPRINSTCHQFSGVIMGAAWAASLPHTAVAGADADTMKRTYWVLALKAAIGAALFTALYRIADARGMFAMIANARASEFLAAGGLMVVALAFNGCRWWVRSCNRSRGPSLCARL